MERAQYPDRVQLAWDKETETLEVYPADIGLINCEPETYRISSKHFQGSLKIALKALIVMQLAFNQ